MSEIPDETNSPDAQLALVYEKLKSLEKTLTVSLWQHVLRLMEVLIVPAMLGLLAWSVQHASNKIADTQVTQSRDLAQARIDEERRRAERQVQIKLLELFFENIFALEDEEKIFAISMLERFGLRSEEAAAFTEGVLGSLETTPGVNPEVRISAVQALNNIRSFLESKEIAYTEVYEGNWNTFYCNCAFTDPRILKPRIDLASCGLEQLADRNRALRLEAEHIVPAQVFGRTRQCWENGGRQACEETDAPYRAFQSDLHNIAPVVGLINERRSSLPFGEIDDRVSAERFGSCSMLIDRERGVADPGPELRGDVARIWLYVSDTHGLPLSAIDRAKLETWHQADPPDSWEIERNSRIAAIQGTSNHWIMSAMEEQAVSP